MEAFNSLQLREVFHLEFLRWFGRKIKARYYALKGGVNLCFFFDSLRYSEDMDLDVYGLRKEVILEMVMQILKALAFQENLKPFGIENIIPPNISKAKQTETTQRFKVHLITSAGEDLFTKIEFSRRGFKGEVITQPVLDKVLRIYKLAPLLVPHYNIQSAIMHKIEALSSRSIIQARDIFDLYILSSQYEKVQTKGIDIDNSKFAKAYDNVFKVSFEQFRDTVISYFSAEDQSLYNNRPLWDEIKLKVSRFIEELRKKYA